MLSTSFAKESAEAKPSADMVCDTGSEIQPGEALRRIHSSLEPIIVSDRMALKPWSPIVAVQTNYTTERVICQAIAGADSYRAAYSTAQRPSMGGYTLTPSNWLGATLKHTLYRRH